MTGGCPETPQKTFFGDPMESLFWWIKHIVLLLTGGFFLLFGIHLLIAAYSLKDPFLFAMTFFASNFIILISAALLFGFVARVFARRGSPKKE